MNIFYDRIGREARKQYIERLHNVVECPCCRAKYIVSDANTQNVTSGPGREKLFKTDGYVSDFTADITRDNSVLVCPNCKTIVGGMVVKSTIVRAENVRIEDND